MQTDDLVYLGHVLETARKIRSKLSGKTRGQYDADEDLQMVLAHLVQIIGEAASRVSAVTRAAHPEIPWKRIVGARNRIVHDYMNLDADVLWSIVTRNVSELLEALEPILAPETR